MAKWRFGQVLTRGNLRRTADASCHHVAAPAPPATGSYTPGDFVRNSAPVELGPVGARYVVEGWTYLSTGFVEKRYFTGN